MNVNVPKTFFINSERINEKYILEDRGVVVSVLSLYNLAPQVPLDGHSPLERL